MKRTGFFIGFIGLLLIFGTLFIGCGIGGSPSSVIRNLHTAVEKGNNEEISKLMTAEAAGLVLKMLPRLQEQLKESGGISKVEQTITGDNAVVKVTYKNGYSDNYDLVKVNGTWKATVKK